MTQDYGSMIPTSTITFPVKVETHLDEEFTILVDVEFYYEPAERDTWDTPGCGEFFEIHEIRWPGTYDQVPEDFARFIEEHRYGAFCRYASKVGRELRSERW